jgi:hypothetical protein
MWIWRATNENVNFAAVLRRLLVGEAPDNMQELDLWQEKIPAVKRFS